MTFLFTAISGFNPDIAVFQKKQTDTQMDGRGWQAWHFYPSGKSRLPGGVGLRVSAR
jgi:hypothetical protein